MSYDEKFMHEAIHLSIENIDIGGVPFGAVVVDDDTVVATGHIGLK